MIFSVQTCRELPNFFRKKENAQIIEISEKHFHTAGVIQTAHDDETFNNDKFKLIPHSSVQPTNNHPAIIRFELSTLSKLEHVSCLKRPFNRNRAPYTFYLREFLCENRRHDSQKTKGKTTIIRCGVLFAPGSESLNWAITIASRGAFAPRKYHDRVGFFASDIRQCSLGGCVF